jgi:hypothetical protein
LLLLVYRRVNDGQGEPNVPAKSMTTMFWLIAAGAMLSIPAIADAGEPIPLTDTQLDRVSAGGVIVYGDAAAEATGLIAAAATGTNSIYGSSPGLKGGSGSEAGIALGTAVAFAEGQAPGDPPPSSSTTVTTGGTAEGNFTMTFTGGGKETVGGLTIQVGFTAVYSTSIPGL